MTRGGGAEVGAEAEYGALAATLKPMLMTVAIPAAQTSRTMERNIVSPWWTQTCRPTPSSDLPLAS
jgi:hypothetical protein